MQKDKTIKDNKGQFIASKGHKLASAVYLITNFLNDSDPVKWDIRDNAIQVMHCLKDKNWGRSLSLIDGLMSLIDLVLVSEQVSEMNFSLLKKEYQLLRDFIQQNPALGLNLDIPADSSPALSRLPGPRESAIAKTPSGQPSERQRLIVDFISRNGAWVSIKEISSALPDLQLSSKTVQRDLLDLVRDGLLRKTGERRWSRYAAG